MPMVLNLKSKAIQGVMDGHPESMKFLRMFAKVMHMGMCIFLRNDPKYLPFLKEYEIQKS